MIIIHLGDAGEHADRTGNGGQRIADFVGDGCGQPADGSQTVLHSYFALQPSNLGEIVEHVDVSQFPAFWYGQGGHPYPNRLAKFRRSFETHLAVELLRVHGGQRIQKQLVDPRAQQFRRAALQKPLGRAIHQRDPPVQTGGDQAAADRVDDVLVQRLQTLECAAGVPQLHAHLPQFRGK